jgi:hypothetical protein
MNKLLKPIILLFIVIAIFFAIQAFTSGLDRDYFQKHQEELTANETIIMSDGEVTNFYYADTPYTQLAGISFWLYLIIPLLSVVILSRKRTLSEAGILGLSFIIITFLLQAKNIYEAGSIEKALLFVELIVGYGGIAMVITLIINRFYHYKPHQKRKI